MIRPWARPSSCSHGHKRSETPPNPVHWVGSRPVGPWCGRCGGALLLMMLLVLTVLVVGLVLTMHPELLAPPVLMTLLVLTKPTAGLVLPVPPLPPPPDTLRAHAVLRRFLTIYLCFHSVAMELLASFPLLTSHQHLLLFCVFSHQTLHLQPAPAPLPLRDPVLSLAGPLGKGGPRWRPPWGGGAHAAGQNCCFCHFGDNLGHTVVCTCSVLGCCQARGR